MRALTLLALGEVSSKSSCTTDASCSGNAYSYNLCKGEICGTNIRAGCGLYSYYSAFCAEGLHCPVYVQPPAENNGKYGSSSTCRNLKFLYSMVGICVFVPTGLVLLFLILRKMGRRKNREEEEKEPERAEHIAGD